MAYKDDAAVLEKLQAIKLANKQRLAEHVKRTQARSSTRTAFSTCRSSALHEYKRQHMNALHILSVLPVAA